MQAHLEAQDDDMWFVRTDGPMKIMKANTAIAITAGAPQWIEKTKFDTHRKKEKRKFGQSSKGNTLQDVGQKYVQQNDFRGYSAGRGGESAGDVPRVLVHICYTLTGTLYPPHGAPPAGSKPRPAEKPGKRENTYRQQYTSPRGTSGSNPITESSINSIRKATDKYSHAMQGIKATTESREPKDLNNSSTARSDQRNNNQFVATGILRTWELPTHLQYTIPDANKQLHLLFPTHEMLELSTPLIAANKLSREMRYGSYPLSLRGIRELPARPRSQHPDCHNDVPSTQIHHPKKLGAKSDAYANRLHKGDVFAHLTSFKQTFKNDIQTKLLSKRSPTLPLSLSSELPAAGNEEDKILQQISLYAKIAIATNSNDVAENYCRNWTRRPLLTAEH
ncbi:hypothetical protein F511_18753 [Dorcoceras hygrometricum]|uniref:Uncharacterized protein n=1 Tax=Dorcoceras hygrometricum TaxID=472368 RepID=A0A2Z7AAT6_9LAMI|nr:hypothetical protein F511_18753 [Dorcoceras hygrometricum]